MGEFKYKILRCEWQVVIQKVDEDWRPRPNSKTVLSKWPTAEEAYADLPNHGREDDHVKGRWIPHSAKHAYETLEIQYREVEIK